MTDDKTKTGNANSDWINVNEPYGLRNWSGKFGVTPERLREIVMRVGPMVNDVVLGQSL